MKWNKKGLIYCPDGSMSWAKHSALTPTPILLSDDIIRVYAGFRDESGVSRIGYVDIDANNPLKILSVSQNPVLGVGVPGAFDDNGVILGDVIKVGEQFYMYYIGFQLVEKVKFLAFTGLAIGNEGGTEFKRFSQVPILDRSEEGLYIRAIHSVVIEEGIWKIWYGVGSEWAFINNRPYPKYNIRCLESKDGVTFEKNGKLCIDFEGNEYRIGRPRVYKQGHTYRMFYTRGTLKGDYLVGFAESQNGINWQRKDELVGIGLSEGEEWDSKSVCYLSLLPYQDKLYAFYNGNEMGKTGFGYAELEGEF